MNILFTCAGRRNYLINYFKEALSGNGKIIASDADYYSPALAEADIGIKVSLITHQDYIISLEEIIDKYKVDVLLSLNDLELPFLAKHANRLKQKGVKVIISSEHVISITYDKYKTYKFLNKLGLKTPKTFISLADTKKAILEGELDFPLVIKPRWGAGSIGVEFIETMEELDLVYKLLKINPKRFIIQKDLDNSILFQEKLIGQEFGLDIINDLNCNYFGTFSRKKILMRGGETHTATSIVDNRFERAGKIIGEKLKHMGIMDCDAFIENGEVYILEMNPRFGGGYPFSHEAGINIAAIYLEWLKGNKNISKFVNYKEGLTYTKCARILNIPKQNT